MTKRNGWTPERRARQAARIKIWAPWAKSTGPKTRTGKIKSANNAFKHGRCARDSRLMTKAFSAQSRFLRHLNALITMKKRGAANELLDPLLKKAGLQGLMALNALQHALFSAEWADLCYEKGADSAYP